MTENPTRILIVEDETELATIVADYLSQAGMESCVHYDGSNAVQTLLSGNFDLAILDIMLPVKDGLAICKQVRQSSNIPIIMTTAKVEEIDRLIGLELGADDYLCKPYSPRELVARVKAVLRRTSGPEVEPKRDSDDGLFLDVEQWKVTIDGQPLDLTRREFQILQILYERPGRVYSRSQLLDLVFPDDADVIDRTIDSHMRNIRRKMGKVSDSELIRSVYGVGYGYEP